MLLTVLVMSIANIGTAWGTSPYDLDITSYAWGGTGNKSANDGTVTISGYIQGKTYNNTGSTKVAFLDGSNYLTVSATSACITSITVTANTDNNSNAHEIAYQTSADGSSWSASTNIGTCANRQSAPTSRTANFSPAVRYVRFTKGGSNSMSVGAISVTYSSGVTYTVTAATEDEDKGTAAAGSATVVEGATTTITATPKSGYKFDHWTVSGTGATLSSTTTNPTTLTMGTANATVTAYFVEKVCPSSGTLYSLTVKSASYSNPGSTETNMVSTYATVTDGGAFLGCKDATNGQVQVKTDGSGTVYFNANNGYVKLVLDCPIQTGDQLTFENGSGSNQICFTTTNTRSTTYTTASNTYTFPAAFNGASTIYVWRTSGSSTYMHSLTITRPAACTAPNHVDISGNYHFFPGETLALTATAYSTAGTSNPIAAGDITGYQWQKYIGSDWENIVGETSATYTKVNATTSDVGQYRCIVSTGATCSTTSGTFNAKCLQLYVYWDNKSDKCNLPFTKVDGTHATVNVSLENGSYTYYYKVTDGCGNWWGNDGTMTSSNCSGWNLNVNNHCGLTTTKAAAYTFNLTYNAGVDAFSMSVVYPSSVQVGGYNLYFANDERNWSNIHYRIGRSNWNSKAAMTLVPGTANLYQTTTIYYESDGGFEAWHIANNGGWSDGNSIYKTNTGDGNAITNATRFEGAPVPSTGLTVIPGSDHSTGGDAQNNNCEFYSYTSVPGMLTRNVSITAPSNGTISVAYTDVEGASQSFTSGNRDLAHTVIITPTATPNTGYALSSLTVNEVAHTSGNTYTVTANTTIAATFSPASYTVTLNTNDGTINAGNVTSYTYGTGATLPTNVTKDGYRFMGWYDNDGLTGSAVTTIANDATGNKTYWAKWAQVYTITNGTPANGTITISKSSAIEGEAVTISVEANTGYTFNAWNIYKTSDAGTTVSPAAASASTSFTMPAYNVTVNATFNAKTTTITINANTANHGSTTPGNVTATYGSALSSFTAATGESGWNLTGYFTAPTSGTKVINADGTLVASTDYADGSGNWKYETASLTLYPQYEEEGGGGDCENLFVCTATSATACTATTGSATYNIAESGGGTCSIGGYSYYIKPNSSNVIVASPKEGKSFAAGDSLIFVVYNPNGTAKTMGFKLVSSSTTYTHEVAAGKLHYFRQKLVAADISAGKVTFTRNSGDDRWVEVIIKHCDAPSCTTPAAPTAFSAGSITSTGATFSITDAGDAASYDIYYSTSSTAPTAGTEAITTSTSKTKAVTDLTASTTYYAWVRSVCDATHKSDWVALSGSSFTTPCTDPVDPASMTVTAKTATSATLTWDDAMGYSAYGYLICLSGGDGYFDWKFCSPYAYEADGLAPNTTYTFHVKARGVGECISTESTIEFTTAAASTYSITYDCDGAESGCPSNVAAATNLPNPLPSAPTKDGYDFVGWYTNSTKTVAAVAGAALSENTTLYAKWTEHVTSECITITDFETSNHSKSDNKPDSEGKYFYGYKGTKDAAHAVTITATNGDCIGVNSGAELKVYAGKYVNIYADNTTTGGTPATFSNVTSVSIDAKMINSSYYTTFDIKVGETTIADDVSLVDAKSSYQTFTYDGLAQLSGKIKIINNGSGSSYNFYADNIQICTADMDACTTPTIPDLSNQSLCSGAAAAAWNATVSNAATIDAAGESVAYKWQKKNGSNWDDISGATTATYDVDGSGTVTEAMEGTYRVVVTVSKAGKSSTTANKEVTLTVTPATETPSITASKAKVYATDEVTLTATCGSTGVTWNWYLCANSDGTGAGSSLGTSATYTIASAPAAGTYYYKAVATGDGTHSCGAAEYVYTLVVSAADACDKEFWFAKEGDRPTGAAAATHITGCPSGSSSASYTASVDGTNYTLTGSTGQKTGNVTIVVPADNTGTLYVVVQGSSSRTITLSKGGTQIGQETPANSTWGVFTFDDLDAGTYTLVSSGNISWAMMALKLCPTVACTDDTPTAAATNATVCAGGSITITATGYEAGATFQWQKQNASTSVWENIDGATSDTYTVATAAAEHAGNYHIVATKNCARTSNTVTIAVPSAPVFGDVPSSVTVMQTIALSISTVEASDAASYKWYKSANSTWDESDPEIGTSKNLIKAYADEATGSPSYYVICRATNSCGTTTSSAIAVNVTAYVDADCAVAGSSGEHNTFSKTGSVSSGTYGSVTELHTNSNNKYLQYVAEDGYYFKTAKVNACVNDASSLPTAAYSYSTDGGANWTDAALPTAMTTAYADHVIDPLPANVNAFRVGRKLGDYGSGSGTLYIHEVCFEYSESCTSTTVTASPTSKTHTIGDSFTKPTFTVKHGETTFDPQPSLTYTSSNEDIATVDDDGTVNFQGMTGTVTITASFAGGTISATEYCASSGSYTITVSCSSERPKIVPGGTVNMSGCNPSVALNAKMQDGTSDFSPAGTYQWYRDGEAISGATSASYTARQAGIYTVERTYDGCTNVSSNNATITSETVEPEVERLVPFQYYHVDKTYSNFMKMRHLFTVKGSAAYGSTGKNFKMELSKNGTAATDVTTSNAFSVVKSADNTVDTVMIDLNKLNGKYAEDDELVFTCKAIDCSGNVSDVYKNTITMRVIGATPTLALICSGSSKAGGTRKTGELTVGGDFLTGYNVADLCQQTGNTSFDANTEWGLYTDLKAHYIVTPVNGYAVFNKLNYEPFDILLLTDYPKASKSDAAKDVLDDMAALCDYRPMLSFKTHMVAKSPSKWAAKGFTTSATENKADGRLNLNIVCYAHPMFEHLKDGANVYRDADNSSELVYTMLSGTGYEGSKGMQGFEIDAAENFVTIGLTHYNASAAPNTPSTGNLRWTPNSGDRMLVTVAERQTNIEARFILFSINCGAQSKLTDKGEEVILACLEYLLDDDPLHVADCSFTFDNGANAPHDAEWYKDPVNCPGCSGTMGDGLWSTEANWGPERINIPGEFTSARIAAPVTVDMEHAKAMELRIIDEGRIDIPAGKALDVKSTIRRMDGSEIYPTEIGDIHIGSGASGNGTLIFNNNSGDTKARVDMYSNAQADVANMSAATSTWQYIGTPHTDVANARSNYYDSWLYQYSGSGWEVIPNGGPLVPFRGYCVTHPAAPVVFDMAGTLVATTTQDIAIPAGYTVIANSWVAPIDINAITDDDMEGISDKSIYFFNTGSDADGNHGTGTEAGTYRTTPIHSASYTGDWQIPSMQGFYISTETAGTLHLDYERHVRPTGSRSVVSNPMYAPKRVAAESDEPNVLKIFARGSRYQDKLIVLEREDFTRGYDSGWDGEAWGGGTLSPMVYVTGEGREDAVSAIPEYEGTVIAFKAGEDEAYTLHFEYLNSAEPLYLYDTENNTYTQIMTGNAYYFTTSDKSKHARFILTRKSPQITTGVEEPTSDSSLKGRARKLLIEDKMFIMVNGVLYDATGKVVK